MVDYRTLLAAVLGVGLGLVMVGAPGIVVRAHTVGRYPTDQHGGYGDGAAAPERWRRIVQLVGVGLVVAGAYFSYTLVA
jgi:hypothetical protein